MARLTWHPVHLIVVRDRMLVRQITKDEYWMELVLLAQEEGCETPFEWKGCLTKDNYREKCLVLSGL
jgi:hypothetical protein